ncbi:enoyl-CoA hydratase-related protein [Mesorhizobium sp. CA4]|uniref:enoyl-CoA hydratase-related protein n=1 Tax=Mesorhizobium sp. CA4 TaxID=588499 RepID=UPI001CD10A89|nr:enoyl-CoA hydratase-related protein [Mesorhizobium sp. CA4]MBZ9819523.1 enoyl-CoA hydratase/isomerase family protein [Mesorhizobium sp. CA4]
MSFHPEPELRGHTLVVTVSSHDGRPVLDRHAYASLARTLHDAAVNDEVRVVMLRGLAGCFCLGGDFSEFLDATKHRELIAAVTDMFRMLATFPKPVLACVDGDAVGVGCTILFHCDMVIASRNSTFRVPFVDFGLVPDAATSILAPQKLGYAGAFRFFCLGDTLGAEDAKALGLVGEIVTQGNAEEVTLARAKQLAKKPVAALLQTRSLLKGDTGVLCDRIDHEITLFQQALQDDTTLKRLQRIARLAA